MAGQMCWLSRSENEQKELYLRKSPTDTWQHYTRFPELCRRDYKIPHSHITPSKGFSTSQVLLKQGWTFAPSNENSLE